MQQSLIVKEERFGKRLVISEKFLISLHSTIVRLSIALVNSRKAREGVDSDRSTRFALFRAPVFASASKAICSLSDGWQRQYTSQPLANSRQPSDERDAPRLSCFHFLGESSLMSSCRAASRLTGSLFLRSFKIMAQSLQMLPRHSSRIFPMKPFTGLFDLSLLDNTSGIIKQSIRQMLMEACAWLVLDFSELIQLSAWCV